MLTSQLRCGSAMVFDRRSAGLGVDQARCAALRPSGRSRGGGRLRVQRAALVAGLFAPGGRRRGTSTDHRPAAAESWWLTIRIVRSRCSRSSSESRRSVFVVQLARASSSTSSGRHHQGAAEGGRCRWPPAEGDPVRYQSLIAVRKRGCRFQARFPRHRFPAPGRRLDRRNAGCSAGRREQIACWGPRARRRRSWKRQVVTSTPSMTGPCGALHMRPGPGRGGSCGSHGPHHGHQLAGSS